MTPAQLRALRQLAAAPEGRCRRSMVTDGRHISGRCAEAMSRMGWVMLTGFDATITVDGRTALAQEEARLRRACDRLAERHRADMAADLAHNTGRKP